MEIINGIHRIDEASENMAHANVYLVINGNELAIIDTGTPGNAQKIIDYVEKKGFKPTDVKFIVLTHHHMDHMGSAKQLRDLTKALVAVHENDADYVSGHKPLPAPKHARPRAAITIESVPVDIRLKEGDRIVGLVVHFLPGHTEGSIMLFDESRKALFTGDSLRYDGKEISCSPAEYCSDVGEMIGSIAKASKLDFEVMLPGHGQPLKANASHMVRNYSNIASNTDEV
jgi:glyoxylase-like metal-dependent hydrolase (beta-lactamase superfamily II)